MILYIHGFNSSPQSFKAQQTQSYFAEHHVDVQVLVPKVPCYPLEALAFLENLYIQHKHQIKGIIGSSLGGYLATYFTEKYQVKAVLINPAVKPYELLSDYLGLQTNPYTNETYELTKAHIDELKSFDTAKIEQQQCYWLLQQQGDEVLDYTQAVAKYQGCRQNVERGGDHSFQGFERYLPAIAEFLLPNEP